MVIFLHGHPIIIYSRCKISNTLCFSFQRSKNASWPLNAEFDTSVSFKGICNANVRNKLRCCGQGVNFSQQHRFWNQFSLQDETMVRLLYLEDLLLTIDICECAPTSFEITKNLFYYEIYLTMADSICLISMHVHYFHVQIAVNTSGCT